MAKPQADKIRSIRIEGVDVPVRYERVPLDEVKLDGDNPRTRELCRRMNGAVTPDKLEKTLFEISGVSALQRAIRDNNGIHEPIYIRHDGRVVEGNCRTAVYRRLRTAFKKNPEWQTIPAYRLPANVTDRQVAVLQGSWHVAGKNSWRAQEQAGHVYHMRKAVGMEVAEIAAALGITESVVERQIATYETMRDHVLPKLGPADGMKKYSYVSELYKNKKLESFRKDKKNVEFVAKLIVDNKLTKGAHVRDLHKVLDIPQAKEALGKDGIGKALSIVGKKDPTADSMVFRKIKTATEALRGIQNPELTRLRSGNKEQQMLTELFKALETVAKHAGVKLK